MSQYFQSYISSSSRGEVRVDLDLTNYATQQDLKNITHVDSSNFPSKTSLVSLKIDADKLHIPKLIPVQTDLSKLFDKMANDLTTKTELNSLETKGNNNHLTTESSLKNLKTNVYRIDSKYVKKSDYDTKVGNLELKIPDVSGKLEI